MSSQTVEQKSNPVRVYGATPLPATIVRAVARLEHIRTSHHVVADSDIGEAIAKALPDAEQVADRWHLMENSSRAFLDAVGKSMRQIRQAVGSNVVDPKLLTYAEKLQYEGYLRRQETNEAILELSKKGTFRS